MCKTIAIIHCITKYALINFLHGHSFKKNSNNIIYVLVLEPESLTLKSENSLLENLNISHYIVGIAHSSLHIQMLVDTRPSHCFI